ncbi:hypothetical protein ACFO6V_07255 [Promicromonospora alba]|uniref:Uncharacterized protein n=1 Tax=Promicromonospora alba TaxID=1616110 RepID=A0ABV9HEW1_9MICO
MSEQGRTYAEYIIRELETERERRATLDARGASVVAVSASLATLLAAVGAFVSGQDDFILPKGAVAPLTLTLLAFAAASACGISATFLWRYSAPAVESLSAMVTGKWMTDEVDARNYVARLDLEAIRSLRVRNMYKARWLIAAFFFQLSGLVLLTVAVHQMMRGAS